MHKQVQAESSHVMVVSIRVVEALKMRQEKRQILKLKNPADD
jgi:hypothetical protein